MINFRYGIFETNSSSTHSLYFATDKEYKDFKDGNTVLDLYSGKFVPWDKAVEATIAAAMNCNETEFYGYEDDEPISFDEFRKMEHDDQRAILRAYDYKSWDDFGDYLEFYHSRHITEHGDVVNVFGEYGHD